MREKKSNGERKGDCTRSGIDLPTMFSFYGEVLRNETNYKK